MTTCRLPAVSSVSPLVLRILGYDPDGEVEGLNTYVVGTGKSRILIDTGDPDFPEYTRILEETMAEHDFQIDHIIITHWHKDHLVGVKDVLDIMNNKYECTIWKCLAREEIKYKYEFPINILGNNQQIHVEGATLTVRHIRGYIPQKMGIILEEDNSLFTVAYEHGKGIIDKVDDFGVFLNLVFDVKPSLLFLGHGPVVKNQIDEINNFVNERAEAGDILYQILMNHPKLAMSEEYIVDKVYKMWVNNYYSRREGDKQNETDDIKHKLNSESPNSTTSEESIEDSISPFMISLDIRKIMAYAVRQHLKILEENGKVLHVRNTWHVIQHLKSRIK